MRKIRVHHEVRVGDSLSRLHEIQVCIDKWVISEYYTLNWRALRRFGLGWYLMTAHRLPKEFTGPPALERRSAVDQQFLTLIRQVARRCRVEPRTDLFHACALLSGNKGIARMAYAEVLMRCLGQALGRQPIFYRPGEVELSFDEAWLLRLRESLLREDEASATFLLKSRVVAHARRNCIFLLRGMSECFRQD